MADIDALRANVYVIGPAAGPFKIGITRDVKARLDSIQISSHAKLSAVFHAEVPFVQRYEIEKAVHAELRHLRLSGEWFNVSIEQAAAAIEKAVEENTQAVNARVAPPPLPSLPPPPEIPIIRTPDEPAHRMSLDDLEAMARACVTLANATGKRAPKAVTRLMWQHVREHLGGTEGRPSVMVAGPHPPDGHEADEQHG